MEARCASSPVQSWLWEAGWPAGGGGVPGPGGQACCWATADVAHKASPTTAPQAIKRESIDASGLSAPRKKARMKRAKGVENVNRGISSRLVLARSGRWKAPDCARSSAHFGPQVPDD